MNKNDAEVFYADPYSVLPRRNDKYASTCTDLHLANKNISKLKDFEKFVSLDSLFLNNNRLDSLEGLTENVRLKNLYLHNNKFRSLGDGGVMCSFPFLKQLTLNGNLLDDLDGTIAELKYCHYLEFLDLRDNPIAQKDDYRLRLIYELPSLKTLDLKFINDDERISAEDQHEKDETMKKLGAHPVDLKTLRLQAEREVESVGSTEKNVKLRLKKVATASRLPLESVFRQMDRRNFGSVPESSFREVLQTYGLLNGTDEEGIVKLLREYRQPVKVPSIKAGEKVGTVTKNMVNYRRFCLEYQPNTMTLPYPVEWRRNHVSDLSVAANNLSRYIAKAKSKELAATINNGDNYSYATMQAGGNSGSLYSETEAACPTRPSIKSIPGLDAWLEGSLMEILAGIDGGAGDASLSKSQLDELFHKMALLQCAPTEGADETVKRILLRHGTSPENNTGDKNYSTMKISSAILRKVLGTRKQPGNLGPAKSGLKGGVAGGAKASAGASKAFSGAKGVTASPVPPPEVVTAEVAWRPLTHEETKRLVKIVESEADRLLQDLLCADPKRDTSALLAATKACAVSLARLGTAKSAASEIEFKSGSIGTNSTTLQSSIIGKSMIAGDATRSLASTVSLLNSEKVPLRADYIVLPRLHGSLSESFPRANALNKTVKNVSERLKGEKIEVVYRACIAATGLKVLKGA